MAYHVKLTEVFLVKSELSPFYPHYLESFPSSNQKHQFLNYYFYHCDICIQLKQNQKELVKNESCYPHLPQSYPGSTGNYIIVIASGIYLHFLNTILHCCFLVDFRFYSFLSNCRRYLAFLYTPHHIFSFLFYFLFHEKETVWEKKKKNGTIKQCVQACLPTGCPRGKKVKSPTWLPPLLSSLPRKLPQSSTGRQD